MRSLNLRMEKHICVDFLVFDRHSLQLQRDVFIEISALYSGLQPSVAVTVQFSDESFSLILLTILNSFQISFRF